MCGVRLTFFRRQAVIVRLDYVRGSQKLLERTFIQHWFALHASEFLRHGGYPQPTGEKHWIALL